MALVIASVGLISYAVQAGVRDEVRDLRSGVALELSRVDLTRAGLEVRGYWHPAGSFVADEVEVIAPRRPELRGEIQSVDAEKRTITIYGAAIAVTAGTRNGDDPDHPLRFSDLRAGQRVEVSCLIEGDRWSAREIHRRDLKDSDKIKGMFHRRSDSPSRLELGGIQVVLEREEGGSALGAMAHIQRANRLLLALLDFRDVAQGFSLAPGEATGRAVTESLASLRKAVDRAYGRRDSAASIPVEAVRRYLDAIREDCRTLEERGAHLVNLAADASAAPRDYYISDVDPFVSKDFLPTVHAYLSVVEEQLGDRLRGLVDRTETTTLVAIGATVVAIFVALVLGLLVWRSIERPIQRLHDAAVTLGKGRLDTRIEVESRDELGVLAEAFNTMAAELASTTVSMTSLESVFDSMAAALVLSDAEGRILNVNRATSELLGFAREDLIGRTIATICEPDPDEDLRRPLGVAPGGRITSVERTFLRADGSTVPVSLSGAELSDASGTATGFVCVAQDLTQQKQVESTIRRSLAEKELLLHEVHHRVKNNMQVISSLLAMQACDGNPEVRRRLEESQNRIRTIALIHEMLYRSPELGHVDIRAYLNVLVEHLVQSFGCQESIRVVVDVDDLQFDLDRSFAVGLIVNELVTNSLKHAFPSGREGTVRVVLHAKEAGVHVLEVSDDGQGMRADTPAGLETLGTSLVQTLARQLGGEIEIESSDGMATRVVFSLQPEEVVAS